MALLLGLMLAAPAPAKQATRNEVTIKDLRYSPAVLKIRAGEKVVWINQDDSDHTVVSDDPDDKDFRSDNLGHGDTFSHTFKKAGKFPYHCKYHPRMKGIIIVSAR